MPDAATAPAAEPAAEAARQAGLRYVSGQEPGLRRVRKGDEYVYLDVQGRVVRDAATLARIRKLVIPPAYESVWICADARGHLQATGVDARGRKQYRYHPEWRRVRDGEKFARMIAFGEALPGLRTRLRRHLALPGLPREKVLAVTVALLDRAQLRIGNAAYTRENGSYGLTTLRDRHVRFLREGRALIQFRGKSGVEREARIDDQRLVRIVRHCQQLPGQRLFQYLDADGTRRAVDSGMVNDYLRALTGAEFTAKDFRTWAGTLRAIALLAELPRPEPCSERALASCIAGAVKAVAQELGNTPAVCRKSYIHPAVFEAWCEQRLPPPRSDRKPSAREAERLTLEFLRSQAQREAAQPSPRRRRSRGRAPS